ncbi:DUF1501 domain-containing protein [Aquimonas sp.]|uniref:DUF1501 domain-containing protein n=1 Tax=Aquimonas sp. TaxID=1872588 RepID=UPI0037C01153
MNRRDLIRRALLSSIGGASLYSQFGNLRLLQAAALDQPAIAKGDDYKALVCVFLNGGNDNVNTVIPRDAAGYATYQNARPGLALPQSALVAGTHLNPLTAQSNGRQYALHPAAAPLRSLFESGRCAIVANVGPLIEPVTRTSFQNGSARVPPQLFSHSDQQVFWQTSRPDTPEKIGWAGRMADLLQASNPNPQLSMSISLRGHNFLQTGVSVQPYSMGTQGAEARSGYLQEFNAPRRAAIDALLNGPLNHPLERASAAIQRRSLDNYALVSSALAANPGLTTPTPTLPEGLGLVASSAYNQLVAQLRMVGRMIQARQQLGQRRQVFFVSVGSYDFHDRLLDEHRDQIGALSHALQMFHAITVELGVADAVTTFTASDFGRTASANGDGSDHGWGGEHFVIGGAVRGRDIYGELPNLTRNGPDDAGWGQLIPKLAVDQYAATLARWFGVSEGQIDTIFPALNASSPRFGPASGGYIGSYRDLGFMTGA